MSSISTMFKLFFLFLLYFGVNGRIHDLTLEMDGRREITLSTFGFLQGGVLDVNVSMFSFKKIPFHPQQDFSKVNINGQFGFTLSKRDNTGGNTYLTNIEKTCTLNQDMMFGEDEKKDTINVILLTLDFKTSQVIVQRFGEDVKDLEISMPPKSPVTEPHKAHKRSAADLQEMPSDSYLYAPVHRRRREKGIATGLEPVDDGAAGSDNNTGTAGSDNGTGTTVSDKGTGTTVEAVPKPQQKIAISNDKGHYSFRFRLKVNREVEQGLYHLYFHNCLGASKGTTTEFGTEVNLSIEITESNNENFLSAGEMPLPTLYFVSCCVFFVMGGVWLAVLRKAKDDVYKIHFLMLTVVYLKCLSLLFHAVHFHFIEVKGTQEEAWAVLYYIAYLMKVTLLFLTILLIGAGWAFVKHLLSEKEKKLFIIFIPLQILANVAFIIVEESEEGMAVYTTWKEIFVLVDLLCCGAILFPVVWSIRHLTEASHTDGKAAINLSKLKLFRQFYILVVCYIYFTRIIVYLLQITVPFKYSWLDELFKQAAIVIFFMVTGVKFRPASDNPYLQVPLDSDDEIEMDEVLTKSGALTTVVKINRDNSDRETTTANKRESSHDYD